MPSAFRPREQRRPAGLGGLDLLGPSVFGLGTGELLPGLPPEGGEQLGGVQLLLTPGDSASWREEAAPGRAAAHPVTAWSSRPLGGIPGTRPLCVNE